jgi:hypothetical protein
VADKTVPWAAVAVTGFEDAPLSWCAESHSLVTAVRCCWRIAAADARRFVRARRLCVCVCVHRGRNEHGAGDVPPGGENDYTFVVLPNDQYWLFVATNKNDTYSA